jgi:RNA polymerase sigma-70 factor (ECF subfamily)
VGALKDCGDESVADPAAPLVGITLVAAIRTGDTAAFEMLYREYWTRLCQFAFRYLQSMEEAEEVVQDVFFRIWRLRTEWNVVGVLDNYMYLAVRNAALDRLERAVVARRWRDHVLDEGGIARSEAPDASVLALDLEGAIERALAELPAKRRTICLLRWTHDMTYAQIADRLGVSEKTVETQIGRGLKFLRERLAELRS